MAHIVVLIQAPKFILFAAPLSLHVLCTGSEICEIFEAGVKEFDINLSQNPIFVDARIVPETIRPHYLTCPMFFVCFGKVSFL